MRASLSKLVVVLLVASVGLWGADASVGKWKLNLAKSKYDPGPPPKSLTRIHEAHGEGVKVTIEGVNAEGKPISSQATVYYDGKDYPVTGSETADTVAVKRIDAYNVEGTTKKGGKVTSTFKGVVSKDGKVMTFTATGTNAKGQPFKNVGVYVKQ